MINLGCRKELANYIGRYQDYLQKHPEYYYHIDVVYPVIDAYPNRAMRRSRRSVARRICSDARENDTERAFLTAIGIS